MLRHQQTALAFARAWQQVDATDRVLGKLAERIALVLMGKHKPIYNPAVDSGDYVIVTNCTKIHVSGRKNEQLVYRKHTMYPGGLKERTFGDMMERKPEEIIRHAVSGMLPKNKLRDRRLERLRIFPGNETGILGVNVLRVWEGAEGANPDPLRTPPPTRRLEPDKVSKGGSEDYAEEDD
ncbi:hypothetical protein D9758_013350 [Tetrapyrgos nigripes]|uniref:50S ribosomal protein L13, chloroplastic n=1 Tax=Tetrapyrgos nigripes TaxID=182062 RepID=A0A8H5CJB2_9AGAR|nr:hypothetical protein D9758_013350 [Tetrapyrgos nigripes]